MIKTEAIVLRAIKFRETSKIVTLYTRELGKVSAIVKGARASKNGYGMALEPMSHISAIIYDKKGREVQLAVQIESAQRLRSLYEDLDKMEVGLQIVELANNAAHEQEKNPALFGLLLSTLEGLHAATNGFDNVLYRFELDLTGALGFGMVFDTCLGCGKNIALSGEASDVDYHLERGALICNNCTSVRGRKIAVNRQTIEVLNRLATADSTDSLTRIEIDRPRAREIESLLWSFLNYHISGIRPLKSKRVFLKMEGPEQTRVLGGS